MDLGTHDFGYWYRVKARACDDDDDCSSYTESNTRLLRVPAPPILAVTRAEPDPGNQTVYVSWRVVRNQTRPDTYHHEILFSNGSRFSDQDPLHSLELPGTTDPLEITISNAWDTLGTGEKTVGVRACNSEDLCSQWTTLRFTMLGPINHQITPDPLELGEISDEWEIPRGVTDILASAQTDGTPDPDAGEITIKIIGIHGIPIRSLKVSQTAQTTSTGIERGRERGIRVQADPDLFNDGAKPVSLTFYFGTSTNGVVLATASIQAEARPAVPTASTPAAFDGLNQSLTLSWNPGTQPTGTNPDHYQVTIPDIEAPFTTTTTALTVPDITEEVAAGTHSAQVRHCNRTGGCSNPLAIPLTLPAGTPKIRIRGLARELQSISNSPYHDSSDNFTLEAFNLTSGTEYEARLSLPEGNLLSADSDCTPGNRERTTNITTTGSARTISHSIWACHPPGGTIMAHLSGVGTPSTLDTYSREITVKWPRLDISGLDTELIPEETRTIQVHVSGLLEDQRYYIRATTSGGAFGLNRPCENLGFKQFNITPGQESETFDIPLSICTTADRTGTLELDLNQVISYTTHNQVFTKTITATTGGPSPITISEPAQDSEVPQGTAFPLTARATNLDPSTNHWFKVSAKPDGTIAFNPECDDLMEQTPLQKAAMLEETITLHPCQPIPASILVELLRNGTTVESTHIDISITPPEPQQDLAPPANLDVVPLPDRKAILSWTGPSTNPTGTYYVVETQERGADWSDTKTRETSVTELEIDLDNVMDGLGLGNEPYSYDFRIKARSGTRESRYSQVITIIENPILRIHGYHEDNDEDDPNGGKATIAWPSISGTEGGYTFRIRELLPYNGKVHQQNNGWVPAEYGTTYTETFSDTSHNDENTKRLTTTIENLTLESIHGIQLTFEVTQSPGEVIPSDFQTVGETTKTKVFSAQDRFTWPSYPRTTTGFKSSNLPILRTQERGEIRIHHLHRHIPGGRRKFMVQTNTESDRTMGHRHRRPRAHLRERGHLH